MRVADQAQAIEDKGLKLITILINTDLFFIKVIKFLSFLKSFLMF